MFNAQVRTSVTIYTILFPSHDQVGEEPPLCNDAERWKRNDTFRVMKKGRKTALRVFDSMNDAKKYCVNSDTSADLSIEHSLGECIRCTGNYCGVAEFCNQFSEDVNE